MFEKSLDYGNILCHNSLFLAPLAGITDIPFRRICTELGAGFCFTEMVSAVAINYGNIKTLTMLNRHQSENILGVQLVGDNPAEMAKAAIFIEKQGFNAIDINMGCPSPKVVKSGGGSALLKHPHLVKEILHAVKTSVQIPVSVKYRIGYTRDDINVELITQIASEEQLNLITVHGRTRNENYSIKANYKDLFKVYNFLKQNNYINKVKFVANGDIFTKEDAKIIYDITKCDGIMIARGALGNPWLFKEILTNNNILTIEEWGDIIHKHLNYVEEYYKETKYAAINMRKHLIWYAIGFNGCKQLRTEVAQINNIIEAHHLIDNFIKNNKNRLRTNIIARQDYNNY